MPIYYPYFIDRETKAQSKFTQGSAPEPELLLTSLGIGMRSKR